MISVSQEIKNKIADEYLSEALANVNDVYEVVDFRVRSDFEDFVTPRPVSLDTDKVLILRKKRWGPSGGETYFYVGDNLIAYGDINACHHQDKARASVGNCFSTYQEAAEAADRMKAALAGGTN